MTSNIFKWKHFESQIFLLCVRWYLKYSLSYRNLEEMMAERDLSVSHTTIMGSGAKKIIFSVLKPKTMIKFCHF